MLLLGKALGNGFHIGAVLLKQKPEPFYIPAMVGGAGDTELAYAAGCAVFEELLENGLLEHIAQVSGYLEEKLTELQENCPQIRQVCCKGLAASVEFNDAEVFETVLRKAGENGLLMGSGENRKLVLRPPYVITEEDIDAVISVLRRILGETEERENL